MRYNVGPKTQMVAIIYTTNTLYTVRYVKPILKKNNKKRNSSNIKAKEQKTKVVYKTK